MEDKEQAVEQEQESATPELDKQYQEVLNKYASSLRTNMGALLKEDKTALYDLDELYRLAVTLKLESAIVDSNIDASITQQNFLIAGLKDEGEMASKLSISKAVLVNTSIRISLEIVGYVSYLNSRLTALPISDVDVDEAEEGLYYKTIAVLEELLEAYSYKDVQLVEA